METVKFANHRNEVERQVIVKLVEGLLASGREVGVNDGEETTLVRSRDEEEIFAAMSTTDEDYLHVYAGDAKSWIRLIYGNGADVISDFGVTLDGDPALEAAIELSNRF